MLDKHLEQQAFPLEKPVNSVLRNIGVAGSRSQHPADSARILQSRLVAEELHSELVEVIHIGDGHRNPMQEKGGVYPYIQQARPAQVCGANARRGDGAVLSQENAARYRYVSALGASGPIRVRSDVFGLVAHESADGHDEYPHS